METGERKLMKTREDWGRGGKTVEEMLRRGNEDSERERERGGRNADSWRRKDKSV